MVRFPFPTAVTAAIVLSLAGSAPALADTSDSSNWAGYAIHRRGVEFTRIVGAWKQPAAKCPRGNRSYSATWIGLGGFDLNSNSLEQIGTEVDCTAAGRAAMSAWYELVPDPSTPLQMRVRPGDEIQASVTVTGNRVQLVLEDRTRHHHFTRTLEASAVDRSSAEWIEEAPSDCVSDTSCQTLPLANFGSVGFTSASAKTTSGHTGGIADGAWYRTRIRLVPGGRRFVTYHGTGVPAGAATTSVLHDGGSAFKISYAEVQLQGNPFLADRASFAAGYIEH